MPKYEIMVLLDPKSELKLVEDLVDEIFNQKISVKKYDQTQLAYEINDSTTGLYGIFDLETSANLINEFRRKANFTKSIWRYLIINLDSERKNKIKKHFKFSKKDERKKPYERNFKQDNRSFSFKPQLTKSKEKE